VLRSIDQFPNLSALFENDDQKTVRRGDGIAIKVPVVDSASIK
jgi:hypothetical protein